MITLIINPRKTGRFRMKMCGGGLFSAGVVYDIILKISYQRRAKRVCTAKRIMSERHEIVSAGRKQATRSTFRRKGLLDMKFLLAAIHAKYIHTGLAVYSLRSYAGRELREHIEVAEYTVNQQMEDILADLYRRRPDVIGFSCYIWNISLVKKLIREFHKLCPEVPIWLGGPEVSYEYEEIFQNFSAVTGIMTGEGEETFRELLQAYVEAERKAVKDRGQRGGLRELALQIRGTATRDGFFGVRDPLDMNALPFSCQELDDAEEETVKNKIIYYESGRGCPFSCSYCLSSLEKQVRLRDMDLVKRELQYFLDKKVKQVKFIDRTFNCNREHAMGVWRFLTEHDNGVTNFHFEISAELLTQEEFKLFSRMRPGLIQLEIGVQTTNREALRAIHRPSNPEKLKMTVLSVYRLRNIHQHLDLIAGLPYEDLRSFQKSFNDVYAMCPDQLQLGFLKVLKGSEMHERAEEYGIVYQSEPPYEVLCTKWLSYEDVLELKKVEKMVELFYNSSQFGHTLQALERLFETPYAMFLSLAEFYEEKGFFLNSPARSYRYEGMLDFVKSKNMAGEVEELFRELLTFDLYLREKAKSRPAFAKDLRGCYQEISAFYRRQEESPDLLTEYRAEGCDSRQMMRMTHMEVFRYPVWDERWLREADLNKIAAGEERFVLFDYKKRNMLSREAGYTVIGREDNRPG